MDIFEERFKNSKFKVGEFVLLKESGNFKLGEIKEITLNENEGAFVYLVFFQQENILTTIIQYELYKIINLEYFKIERKKEEED